MPNSDKVNGVADWQPSEKGSEMFNDYEKALRKSGYTTDSDIQDISPVDTNPYYTDENQDRNEYSTRAKSYSEIERDFNDYSE